MRLVFGEVVIDGDRRLVTRHGQEVHLSGKAFALLDLLIERRPNAVKRAEIFDHVWPDTFVSPSNVATLAQEIRDALGDDARRPRFLRTIFGYGYAFIGEEDDGGNNASVPLRLIIGATQIELAQRETILGRRIAVLASDPAISRDHARVVVENQRVFIEDLGSKNGTFVGARRIDAPTELVDGDVISIGSARIVFRAVMHNESTMTLAKSDIPALS
jgi:DNA-binding winged helix-turn-helix (wHTH) protein